MEYSEFLEAKRKLHKGRPIPLIRPICSSLFPFQKVITQWALKKGKSAIFADCGLGKTIMQLAWAEQIPGRVLIVAPLAVSEQTIREGRRFGIDIGRVGESRHIDITNYEQLHKISSPDYQGVVLDESSILKNYAGKTRNKIIEMFAYTEYKLACTATPAPNDFMELGNHAEFLDICARTEMLAEYFVHDGGETQKWRLKKHATAAFWRWVSSWAMTLRNPADIGFPGADFILPELIIDNVVVRANYQEVGFLFPMQAATLEERRNARKHTVGDRAAAAANLIRSKPDESWLVWCNLNREADALRTLLGKEAVEIRGSDSQESKTGNMLAFTDGEIRVLITKPSIAGHGMNWQHCHNVIFLGLSDSYEEFYQAIRRCWRFGQKENVTAYVITSDVEGAVVANINRKEASATQLNNELISQYAIEELRA